MTTEPNPPPPAREMVSKTTLVSLLSALYYISTSVSLTLFNKLLFSGFPSSNPPFLLLCQSITAVLILLTLRLLGRFDPPQLQTWGKDALRKYAPLYVSNLVMLLTSLIALKFTSLLMYNTLRRTSMIFVVAIHSAVNSTRPSSFTVAATALVTFGALWAGSTDLAFDPVGYSLAFAANLSTAVYLVLLRPVRDKLQLSNLQLIFVNALANIPVLVFILLIFPPVGLIALFADIKFSFLFLCSCSFAMVINHAIFVNTTTNDAIAQSISSQLKDVVLLITSIMFVDDPSQRASGNLKGVLLGFSGSIVYGIGKLMPRKMEPKKQDELPTIKPVSADPSERVTLVTAQGNTSGS